jgi:hypothetical protein
MIRVSHVRECPQAGKAFVLPAFGRWGRILSSDPAIVAVEVRAQVTEVVLICNRILATAGHHWAIQAAGAGSF